MTIYRNTISFVFDIFRQPGTILVMAQRGVPVMGKSGLRGDHLVKLVVELPKRVSGEEKKLLEQLQDLKKPKTAGSRYSENLIGESILSLKTKLTNVFSLPGDEFCTAQLNKYGFSNGKMH